MTSREEYTEIGRMYVERDDADRRRQCIRNKILHLLRFMQDAVKEMDGEASTLKVMVSRSVSDDENIPDEIKELFEEERSLRARISELDKFFEALR